MACSHDGTAAPGALTDPSALTEPEPSRTWPASAPTIDRVQVARGERVTVEVGELGSGHASDATVTITSPPVYGRASVDPAGIVYLAKTDGPVLDSLEYAVRGRSGQSRSGRFFFEVTGPVMAVDACVVRSARRFQPGLEYRGGDPADPRFPAVRRLAQQILADYGNPTTSLDKARALRDWVARAAIHPFPPFHSAESQVNRMVLPIGMTWGQVNSLDGPKTIDDSNYWATKRLDGIAMLDELVGAVSGHADAMMTPVAGSWYRVRDFGTYRFVLCTYQAAMVNALWSAAGLHGMMVSTWQHDGAAVFVPALAKWVWMDPTFNDEYALDGAGDPLSPAELLHYSLAGQAARLVPRNRTRPTWDAGIYADAAAHPAASYVGQQPTGFLIIGSQLNNRDPWRFTTSTQVDGPYVDAYWPFKDTHRYRRVSPEAAFPDLGVGIDSLVAVNGGIVVHLFSNQPDARVFQRRIASGPWQSLDGISDTLRLPASGTPQRIFYRSQTEAGVASAVAELSVGSGCGSAVAVR